MRGRLHDLPGALVLGDLLLPQREAHVLRHGHVRIEGVALEDHGHVPVLGLDERDVTVADEMAPSSQASRPASMRSAVDLPRPGWADQDEELPVSRW